MKRDMDLVRQVLLQVEAQQGPLEWRVRSEEDVPDPLLYHLELAIEAGLVEGKIREAGNRNNPYGAWVERLTWEGHDFLDAVRNDTVWAKTKATMKEKGVDLAFSGVKALAIFYGKALLGLP